MKSKNRLPAFILGLLLTFSFFQKVHAASFDCEKASTALEKLICSNDYVSDLDAELGQEYQKALIKYAEKKDMLIKQQRNWIKWIRSQCKDPSCLATLYEVRIGELVDGNDVSALSGTDKPNFILTDGRGLPLCEEYLDVLNNTQREDLRACKLPDLSKSNIKPVEFKQLTGERLKTIDRIIYEQNGGGPWTDWDIKWTEREREYSNGYRFLGEAYWDFDHDGKPDQIIMEKIPHSRCGILGNGNASTLQRKMDSYFKSYTSTQAISFSIENGFKSFYGLIRNEKYTPIRADNFVTLGGEFLSVDHKMVRLLNTDNAWASREWVSITKIKNDLDEEHNVYDINSTICKFWINK